MTPTKARRPRKPRQTAIQKAEAAALTARLHGSHQRIAEFMNPLPVAEQKTCVGKLLAASEKGDTYRDDPGETNRIVRIVSQSLGDVLRCHASSDRAALLQQIVDEYGTPEIPSARERAIIERLNRSRKRKRF